MPEKSLGAQHKQIEGVPLPAGEAGRQNVGRCIKGKSPLHRRASSLHGANAAHSYRLVLLAIAAMISGYVMR